MQTSAEAIPSENQRIDTSCHKYRSLGQYLDEMLDKMHANNMQVWWRIAKVLEQKHAQIDCIYRFVFQ